MAKQNVAISFLWGVLAKIIDAGIKFVSLPFLLTYFGKDNFGLIALASSVNAYLQLLDMGVNTGGVKYFSEWIARKDYALVDRVARTSISFYFLVGVLNAALLALVAIYGLGLFSVTQIQALILKDLILILALFTVLNWASSVFIQLLTASEDIVFMQQIMVFRNLANLIIVGSTFWLNWDIETYFLWSTGTNCVTVFPFFIRVKSRGLIRSLLPALNWPEFRVILRYSVAIILIAIFQMSAAHLRPIILSIFSSDGIGVLSEYRIIETITLFIVSIGGTFITIFLPKASKLLASGVEIKIKQFAYEATLYTSIACVFLCMPFVLCASEVISLYVGKQYTYLSSWLILWVITILFYLHNTPVSSLVLASGKTKTLIYSSAFSCIISLTINAFLSGTLGTGSAVIGYSVYIFIQMSFYYFYFNKNVLNLNSLLVFKSFIIPTIIGFATTFIVMWFDINFTVLVYQLVCKVSLWCILFLITLFVLRVVDIKKAIEFFKIDV